MGRFQRIEQRLERAINGAFAKAFRAEVQVVEIASSVRRAMDDGAMSMARGRTLVPSNYTVELSGTDFERLTRYEDDLENELVAAAEEHADSQHYQTKGAFALRFRRDDTLETGLFRVIPETSGQHPKSPYGDRPESARGTDRAPEYQGAEYQGADYPGAARTTPDRGGYRGPDPGLAPSTVPPIVPVLPPLPPPVTPPAAAAPYDYERDGTQNASYEEEHPAPRPAARVEEPATRAPHELDEGHRRGGMGVRSTAPADRPWLEHDGDRYILIGPLTVLGRDNLANIIVDDVNVSRRHSEIRVTTDGPHLLANVKDLGSTNGTWVNGERITSRRLADGDRITIGQTELIFHGGRR